MTRSNTDVTVSQVLPGRSSRVFEGVATNFGLSSSAFQALQDEFSNSGRGISPNIIFDRNASPETLKSLFDALGLYTGGGNTSRGALRNKLFSQPFIFSFQNLGTDFAGPAKFYNRLSSIPKNRWVLPVPPPEIKVQVPNNQTTITSITGHNYTHAGPIELDEISFEGFFPHIDQTLNQSGNIRAGIPDFIPEYINFGGGGTGYAYRTPHAWVANLVAAMRANQPLIFGVNVSDLAGAVVTTTNGVIIEPTAMSVSAFDWEMGVQQGGTNRDVSYSITLKRWRRQDINITNYVRRNATINTNTSNNTASNNSQGSGGGPSVRTYTVQPGDYLIKIAQRFGLEPASTRWREIYELNKNVIGSNPNLITPGMVLKIPRK